MKNLIKQLRNTPIGNLAIFTVISKTGLKLWEFIEDVLLVVFLGLINEYKGATNFSDKISVIIQVLYFYVLFMLALKITFKPLYNLINKVIHGLFKIIGLGKLYEYMIKKNKINKLSDMLEDDYIEKKNQELSATTTEIVDKIKQGGKTMDKLLVKIRKDILKIAILIVNNKKSLAGSGFVWVIIGYLSYLLYGGYLDAIPHVTGNHIIVEAALIIAGAIIQSAISDVGFENLLQINERKKVEVEYKKTQNVTKELETAIEKAKQPTLKDTLSKLLEKL